MHFPVDFVFKFMFMHGNLLSEISQDIYLKVFLFAR